MQDEKKPQAFPYCGIGDDLNYSRGMTMRDYFAAKAMQAGFSGHIAHYGHDNYWSPSDIATHAYEMADAMLIARAK